MSNVTTKGCEGTSRFASVKEKVAAFMRNLLILVKMQLKEKLNWKRRSLKDTGVFKILFSIFITVLKFALVTVMSGAFMFVCMRMIVVMFMNMFFKRD